jgi:hypothetical protein
MHKTILMMLLAVVSSSAMAEWTKFGNNETKSIVVYVKLPTIREARYRVKMWVLLDYETDQELAGKSYKSITTQGEYDCKEEQMRLLYAAYYAGNMSRGDAVAIDQNPTKWSPASPGSIDEGLWKFACGMD